MAEEEPIIEETPEPTLTPTRLTPGVVTAVGLVVDLCSRMNPILADAQKVAAILPAVLPSVTNERLALHVDLVSVDDFDTLLNFVGTVITGLQADNNKVQSAILRFGLSAGNVK